MTLDAEQERLCLQYNPFAGDETDVREMSDKFVRTKLTHKCTICWETIPLGVRIRALREINNEDRKAAMFYFCEPCCEAMAKSWKDEGRSIEERTAIGMGLAEKSRSDCKPPSPP